MIFIVRSPWREHAGFTPFQKKYTFPLRSQELQILLNFIIKERTLKAAGLSLFSRPEEGEHFHASV